MTRAVAKIPAPIEAVVHITLNQPLSVSIRLHGPVDVTDVGTTDQPLPGLAVAPSATAAPSAIGGGISAVLPDGASEITPPSDTVPGDKDLLGPFLAVLDRETWLKTKEVGEGVSRRLNLTDAAARRLATVAARVLNRLKSMTDDAGRHLVKQSKDKKTGAASWVITEAGQAWLTHPPKDPA